MKDIGIVQGSAAQAKELIVGKNTVYVHTNIVPVTEDAEGNPITGLYQYNEIQYDKDEYIALMDSKNTALQHQLEVTQEAVDFLLLGME